MVVTWLHFSPTKSWLLHCCPVSRSALTFKLVENTVQEKKLSHTLTCSSVQKLQKSGPRKLRDDSPLPALLSRRHVFPWSAVIFDFLAGIIKFSPSANWVPLLIWFWLRCLSWPSGFFFDQDLPLYQSWPGKDLKVPISRYRTRYGYTWVHPGAIWPQLLLFVHLIISPQRFLLSFVLSLFWHRVSSPSDVDFVGSTWDLCWTLLPFVINGFLSECLAVSTICSHHRA